ncbi:MAG: PAS domain-containing sensor histidine kinase [Methylococcales bacterium]|nr:MAG: PAS domain-containing sensor histidine kinase [Methylococcales bacterium]
MNPSTDIHNLRQRAILAKANRQKTLIDKSRGDIGKMTADEIQTLVYELQVHQIELVMQNEELINTQQSLRKSENDYTRIYDLAPIAYLTLSQKGLIQQANIAATTLFNLSREKLFNQRLEKLIHADDQDAYYLFFRNMLKEQPSSYLTIRITNANQYSDNITITYLELKATVVRQENNELIIYLVLKDVTAHKVMEDTLDCINKKQAIEINHQHSDLLNRQDLLNLKTAEIQDLHQSSYKLKEASAHIFNVSSEGIVMLSLLGVIESTNPAACLLFGYSEAELLGMSFNQLLITPLFSKSSINLLQNSQNNIASSYRVEGLHSNGSIVPLSLSLVDFTLEQSEHFAIVIRDNSLHLQQERLEKAHLAEIANMTRLSLIGSMGSGIAHQVNQPLTAISNYSQACIQLIKAEQPDLTKLSEVLSKTYEQAQKAGKIIHRMKDLASQRTTSRTMTSIDTLIENAVNFCAHECYQDNIQVTLELNPNIPKIAMDSVQIEQVLLNLIRNAIDALKEQVKESDKTISIQTQLNKGLEVRVKDNGPGLTDLQKEKILMPFYTSKSSGMGMGLSISRSIIEAHGGDIKFNSKLGVGTTFYFNLPIHGESL